MTHSLRSQLLGWVLLPLATAVAIDATITWRNADRSATVVQDRLLLGSARIIAEQLRYEDGAFQHPIPPAALELFQSGGVDRIYYSVTTASGQLLTGSHELDLLALGGGTQPLFFDATLREEPVRAVGLQQPVIGSPDGKPVTVEVAQTLHGHHALRQGLWRHTVAEQVLILFLAAVLILFGLRRGLMPLLRLRDVVLARSAGALEPLALDDVPTELAPLVIALNDYVHRLQQYTGAQRIFIENAAHQLRTPLTLLSTQVSFATRTADPQARQESLAAVRQSLQQTIRLVNQLLTLSAAQARVDNRRDFRPVALDVLVQQALEDLASLAQAKAIDLGFETDPQTAPIEVHPVMLRELVVNLLDNAIRYTPEGGVVTARITTRPHALELSIEDNGPGIAAADRERVFDRFFRVEDQDSRGSGLGLAIVREFAQQLGASVTLSEGRNGCGLTATVAFIRRA